MVTTSPARSRTPLVIGIVVAVVVALAVVVGIVVGTGDDEDASPGQGATDGSTEVGDDTDDGGSSPAVTPDAGESADDGDVFPAVQVDGDPLPGLTDPANDPAVGATPPTLTGSTYGGEAISIEPGADGATMVVFLAHWCPHCNDEIPVLLEWRDAGMIPEGLEIVGVSTGVDEDAPNFPPDEWLADKGWTWPAMGDSEDDAAAAAYGLTGYPFFTLVGADGTVKLRAGGEIPLDALDTLVDEALAG